MDSALASVAAAPPGAKTALHGDPEQAARRGAEEFESVFLGVMLDSMFEGIEAEPPFGGGHAERSYRSLLVSEYAQGIARNGGIGIADHVYREMLAVQEGANS